MRSTISTLLSRVWPGLAPRKQAGGIPVSFHHLRYEVIDERPMGRMDCVGRKGVGNAAVFVEKGVGIVERRVVLVESICRESHLMIW